MQSKYKKKRVKINVIGVSSLEFVLPSLVPSLKPCIQRWWGDWTKYYSKCSFRGGHNRRWWGHSNSSLYPGVSTWVNIIMGHSNTASCAWIWALAPSLVPRRECLHHLLQLGMSASATCAISCARSRVLMPSVAPEYEYLHYFLCPSMRTCSIPCTQAWVLVSFLVPRHEYLCPGTSTCTVSCT